MPGSGSPAPPCSALTLRLPERGELELDVGEGHGAHTLVSAMGPEQHVVFAVLLEHLEGLSDRIDQPEVRRARARRPAA